MTHDGIRALTQNGSVWDSHRGRRVARSPRRFDLGPTVSVVLRRLCCVVLACLSVSPVLAECLDGDSIEQGVLVRFADGTELTITRQDGDLLHLVQALGTNGTEIIQAWHGVFISTSEFGAADGNHVQMQTKFLVLPPTPMAGAAGMLPVQEFGSLTMLRYQVEEVPPLAIGACSYEMMVVVQDRVIVRGRTPYDGSLYFPSLGFGFAGEADAIAALELLR